MRVGIDTYSYHRLHGASRAGEPAPPGSLRSPWREDVADARRLGVDALALQTMFLGAPGALDLAGLRAEAAGLELLLSWGGVDGLRFGADGRLGDLPAWMPVARDLGVRVVRIVLGGPAYRGTEPSAVQIRRVAPVVRQACAAAGAHGIVLAVENHGDLNMFELFELLEQVGDETLGICLDVANVARLGDDPVQAARASADRLRMVHLRDCDDPAGADFVTGPRMRRYGEGVIPVGEVVATLAGCGFDGPVCVELAQLGDEDERDLVADCVDWLRRSPAATSSVSRRRGEQTAG